MKKGIFGLIIIAVTAIAGWNYSKNNNDVKLLDLTLNNIEALASDEYHDSIWDIYSTSTGHSCVRGGSHSCL
ncbi:MULTISPECIES: NVEALA domain-containing protein [Parabacteroides]|uniref:NVEALA family protein n=1 Tax=Parabacteroides distasonis TaxID=823 RepID=A0A3L7ZRT8_PARDI|nr:MULTISPECIES: NVEALA domain-containing protein [Parabacteroides]MDB9150505.1 NVEALA domain-containing protein [Parabacteroides distasonis]MDB9155046.1 NVEALA domain-containing protein [Parabacteroides distasonis]MDB9164057.1 NVEALA domain-containing protein [Parabacteroides distasonis]MDB9168794.1 NVEALA domain-containing protein [Parabacteroides distasonis]MDB9196100.1 NVEALA domain-containing protein [Parabacteroides distasonis]